MRGSPALSQLYDRIDMKTAKDAIFNLEAVTTWKEQPRGDHFHQ